MRESALICMRVPPVQLLPTHGSAHTNRQHTTQKQQPDVRFVVHYSLSKSAESYIQVRAHTRPFSPSRALTPPPPPPVPLLPSSPTKQHGHQQIQTQESGRAGRDGQRSTCLLMYRASDAVRQASLCVTERMGASLFRFVPSPRRERKVLTLKHTLID